MELAIGFKHARFFLLKPVFLGAIYSSRGPQPLRSTLVKIMPQKLAGPPSTTLLLPHYLVLLPYSRNTYSSGYPEHYSAP